MSLSIDYQNQINSMLSRENSAVPQGFWTRWSKLHSELIKDYESDFNKLTNENQALIPSAILKTRERMVSVVLQHLNKTQTAKFAGELRQHDEILRKILQHLLQKIQAELTKAFATRNALSGYAQTTMFRESR